VNKTKFKQTYGSWAIVTGASDGIGRAFAWELAKLGLGVVLAARRQDRLDQLAGELRGAHGIETRVIACDLSTGVGIALLDESVRDLDLGLLVAAAGFGSSGPFLNAALLNENAMLHLNCLTVMNQCFTYGKRFAERRRGGIILMGSLLGWQGIPESAHYAATKAYVQSLAESLHIELARQNVDVLASAPGPVRSGFAGRADMRMHMAIQPEVVAATTLAALGRKTTVIPGALSKLLTYSLLPMPRSARTFVLGRVMAGMTSHQAARLASKGL